MAMSEAQRLLNQHGNDIAALYEISARIEDKVDRLTESTNIRFDAVNQRLDTVDKRFDTVDKRFDTVDKRFDTVAEELAIHRTMLEQILQRLVRDAT